MAGISSPWANVNGLDSSVSDTILFRGPSGISDDWDSLLISAIFQNGRLKILDFQYLGNYFT